MFTRTALSSICAVRNRDAKLIKIGTIFLHRNNKMEDNMADPNAEIEAALALEKAPRKMPQPAKVAPDLAMELRMLPENHFLRGLVD